VRLVPRGPVVHARRARLRPRLHPQNHLRRRHRLWHTGERQAQQQHGLQWPPHPPPSAPASPPCRAAFRAGTRCASCRPRAQPHPRPLRRPPPIRTPQPNSCGGQTVCGFCPDAYQCGERAASHRVGAASCTPTRRSLRRTSQGSSPAHPRVLTPPPGTPPCPALPQPPTARAASRRSPPARPRRSARPAGCAATRPRAAEPSSSAAPAKRTRLAVSGGGGQPPAALAGMAQAQGLPARGLRHKRRCPADVPPLPAGEPFAAQLSMARCASPKPLCACRCWSVHRAASAAPRSAPASQRRGLRVGTPAAGSGAWAAHGALPHPFPPAIAPPPQDNGCGGQIACGECAADQVCQDGACAAKPPAPPACVPDKAALCANYVCGEVDDGWWVAAGARPRRLQSGSGHAGSQPERRSRLHDPSTHANHLTRTCLPTPHPVSHSPPSGGTISCGNCTVGLLCSVDMSTCFEPQPPCTPLAQCTRQCGPQADGCGGALACGSCPPGQACSLDGQCIGEAPRRLPAT
jgi:hypothetical protein